MLRSLRIFLPFLAIALLVSRPVLGQDTKLIEAAKKEGGKALAYGSLETETYEPVAKAFEKKTGLKVEYWRGSATKVMDRALSEYRAGKPLYDLVITNRNPMDLMKDAGLLARYESRSWKTFTPDVIDAFFGPAYRYNVFGMLYNTKLIKPADAPQSLEDLLKPQYKGKIVVSDPTQHTTFVQWLANLHKMKARGLLEGLVFIPWAFPGTALAIGLLWAYVDFPVPVYATIWILMIAYVTRFIPYGLRAVTSTIIQIHKELEEASVSCGAGFFATFRRIVFPLMRPGLMAGWIILATIYMREFSASIFLYSPASEPLGPLLYFLYIDGMHGPMAALGIVISIVCIVLIAIAQPFSRWGTE